MKIRQRIIILSLLIMVSVFGIEPVSAQEVLPSGIADREIEESIQKYIEENKETTAGVSVGVFRGDDTIARIDYGYANSEKYLEVNQETIFEWGSVGKLLVWTSVMQLWEQGLIDLEANIQNYLPEGYLSYEYPITMVNLMNHNAGFEDIVFEMAAIDEESLLTLKEALVVTQPKQVYQPGKVTSYSNYSTALAGYIVELISHQPFYQYVDEHIFEPLEMHNTSVHPNYEDHPHVREGLLRGQGYTSDLKPMNDGFFYLNLYPAGSVAGTLDDMMIFAKAITPNTSGNQKIFKNESTLNEMLSPTMVYPGTDIDYNNHGLWSHEYDVQALGHGGNSIMYSSYLLFDPISQVGLVIMTNQESELIYNYGLPPLVYGPVGSMTQSNERNENNAAGLYYNARTIRGGIASMYTVLNIQPYTTVNDYNLKSSLFGTLDIQVAPDTYLSTQKIGDFELTSLSRYSVVDGIKTLTSPYGQSIEADAGIWILSITLVLLVIAILWSVVVIGVSLIRFIHSKITKSSLSSFNKVQVAMCLCLWLLVANILWVAQKMLSMEATHISLIINVVMSVVLAIIPIVYAIYLIKSWPKLVDGKLAKFSYLMTLMMGFVITLTVIVLEMYKI